VIRFQLAAFSGECGEESVSKHQTIGVAYL
jgi:hypothetical protein